MTLTPVKSSAVSAVGYDPATKTMHVQFVSGGTYEYTGVPADVHAAFVSAPSIGKHHFANIRGKFAGTKLS